jgi:hypothetical protein
MTLVWITDFPSHDRCLGHPASQRLTDDALAALAGADRRLDPAQPHPFGSDVDVCRDSPFLRGIFSSMETCGRDF